MRCAHLEEPLLLLLILLEAKSMEIVLEAISVLEFFEEDTGLRESRWSIRYRPLHFSAAARTHLVTVGRTGSPEFELRS